MREFIKVKTMKIYWNIIIFWPFNNQIRYKKYDWIAKKIWYLISDCMQKIKNWKSNLNLINKKVERKFREKFSTFDEKSFWKKL